MNFTYESPFFLSGLRLRSDPGSRKVSSFPIYLEKYTRLWFGHDKPFKVDYAFALPSVLLFSMAMLYLLQLQLIISPILDDLKRGASRRRITNLFGTSLVILK